MNSPFFEVWDVRFVMVMLREEVPSPHPGLAAVHRGRSGGVGRYRRGRREEMGSSALSRWDGCWPLAGTRAENDLICDMIRLANMTALRLYGGSLRHGAEDAASQAVVAVVFRLRGGDVAVENLGGYLVRAVKNEFMSDVRASDRRRALLERLAPMVDVVASPERSVVDRAEVRSLFAQLPRRRPRMRDGDLVLRAQQLIAAGYTQGEAAELLQISRENLVKKLKDYSEAVIDLRDSEVDPL